MLVLQLFLFFARINQAIKWRPMPKKIKERKLKKMDHEKVLNQIAKTLKNLTPGTKDYTDTLANYNTVARLIEETRTNQAKELNENVKIQNDHNDRIADLEFQKMKLTHEIEQKELDRKLLEKQYELNREAEKAKNKTQLIVASVGAAVGVLGTLATVGSTVYNNKQANLRLYACQYAEQTGTPTAFSTKAVENSSFKPLMKGY